MDNQPVISIITACYNSAKTIEDTIRSVAEQDYPYVEYIVIDGKSTDGTVEIIKKYQDEISYWVSEKDNGIFDAFNKGIMQSSGDIVGILNSDDFYAHSGVLSSVAREFIRQKTDSVYGDLVYVDSQNPDRIVRYWRSKAYRRILFRFGWMPAHPTFFCKRDLYRKYGLFNTWMKISNDYEILLRFLYKFRAASVHIPEVLVKMRTGGNSNGSVMKRIVANREDRQSWVINGLKPPLLTIYLKPLLKIGQFFVPRSLKKKLATASPN